MNIFIYGILFIFAVNLSKGSVISLKNDKINMLKLPRAVGDDIKSFLEEIRKRMCHEIPNKGIPKLDPFGLDKLNFNIEEDLAQLDIEINNLSARGLGKFDFPTFKFNTGLMKVDFELVLPKLLLTTDYKVNGTIKDFLDLNGNGDIRLEVEDIRLVLGAKFKFNNGTFSFKINKLEPSIDSIKCRINNLFTDEELNDFVSEMITDIGLVLIFDMWTEYKEDVQNLIEALVTGLLEGLTIKDLLAMIGNIGDFFDENDPAPNCKFDDLFKFPQVFLLN